MKRLLLLLFIVTSFLACTKMNNQSKNAELTSGVLKEIQYVDKNIVQLPDSVMSILMNQSDWYLQLNNFILKNDNVDYTEGGYLFRDHITQGSYMYSYRIIKSGDVTESSSYYDKVIIVDPITNPSEEKVQMQLIIHTDIRDDTSSIIKVSKVIVKMYYNVGGDIWLTDDGSKVINTKEVLQSVMIPCEGRPGCWKGSFASLSVFNKRVATPDQIKKATQLAQKYRL